MLISVAQFQLFFLALTRIMAIIVTMPFLGGATVPNSVKISLGFILTLILIPWQPVASTAQIEGLLPFTFAILQELVIGIFAGFAVTLTFAVFQMVGKLMELGAGFSAGQIFNPTLGEMASSYDQLFMMVVFVYFFTINGHHVFLIGLEKTFQVLPIHSGLANLDPMRIISVFSNMILSAFQLALPVMGAILLADLTLGLLAKVAPQIQVFFLGLPVKVWLGVVALGLSYSAILPLAGKIFQQMSQRMLYLIGA
jgi:flagellar biosynthetic protein FliR